MSLNEGLPLGLKIQIDKILIGLTPPERNFAERQAKQLLTVSQRPITLDRLRQQILIGMRSGGPVSEQALQKAATSIIAILIGLLLPAVQKARQAGVPPSEIAKLQGSLQRYQEAVRMLSNIMSTQHKVTKGVIKNLRA